VTGHVFISYSHDETAEYVHRLETHLNLAGIAVWDDKEIISGDHWRRLIREQIDTCAAVIIVMTPDAEQSPWVNCEIVRAENGQKPILPLLLRGTGFFGPDDLQYADVSTGTMPTFAFTNRLRCYLAGRRRTHTTGACRLPC
jgi:hypothetical protein